MQKEQLEEFISQNLSIGQIAKQVKKSKSSVLHWLNKYNLKTNYKKIGDGYSYSNQFKGIHYPTILTDYDWPSIQKAYDDKGSWRTISKQFNISMDILNVASKRGIFKSRPFKEACKLAKHNGHPCSPKTRAKLSIARKNYLKSNNLHRWHNKSNHHTSWFCESVKKELKERNISFTEEFMPLKHINRFFSLDVAIPELKIGFELNGRQHYSAEGGLLPYYQKRHDLIVENGWVLHEIKYSKDIKGIADFIQSKLT